jgi:hypothetical protein
MSPGDADPAQQQLFDAAAWTETPSEVAAQHGYPKPQASSERGGFLPDIGPVHGRTAHQRKVNALQGYAAKRSESPLPGGGTSIAAEYTHLQSLRDRSAPSAWYSEKSESGISPGHMHEVIGNQFERSGVSEVRAVRAVAQMSPQMPWSSGNPLYRGYPNVEDAREVARTVGNAPQTPERAAKKGLRSPGQGLPLSKQRAAQAIAVPNEPSRPMVHEGSTYKKVSNFNESGLASAPETPQALRGAYSGSYTADMWMLQHAHHLTESSHKIVGGYDIQKTLAQRAAYKRRELPMDFQAAIWSHVREPDPLTVNLQTAPGRYTKIHSLLSEEGHPNFDFSKANPVVERRSATAQRHGLEF